MPCFKSNIYKIFDKYSPKKAKKYNYCLLLKNRNIFQQKEFDENELSILNIVDIKKIKRVYKTDYSFSKNQTERVLEKIYLKDMNDSDILFIAGLMNTTIHRIYRLKQEK